MIEVTVGLVISAFIAGVLMFLAPCTLPLVPAYLAFISGVKQSDLTNTETAETARQSIIVNSTAFVLGFSFVFIAFGMLAGYFGSQVGQFKGLLTQIGGVFIIIFGLLMLRVVNFTPLLKERKVSLPSVFVPGNPLSAFVIGATFALGWTPCVGPVLASVLLLASTQATVASGGALLAVFSVGLSIPFLLTAFLYARATKTISRLQTVSDWVSRVGGMFLIFIGVLLVTDNFGLMVEYGYRVFHIFGVEALFDYL